MGVMVEILEFIGGQVDEEILIVDDEEHSLSIRRSWKRMDLQWSWQERQEALDKLHLFEPDLITLDIKMPVMDGIEA